MKSIYNKQNIMATTPEFKYAPMFQTGEDKTESIYSQKKAFQQANSKEKLS